jgi:hypothetical protein
MSDKDKDDLEEEENTTGKDIKKGMDKYEAKIRSGEDPQQVTLQGLKNNPMATATKMSIFAD